MINTVEKMRVHLKIMKKQLIRQGADKFQLYPMFCMYYDKHKEKYSLPKSQILDLACEVLIEED